MLVLHVLSTFEFDQRTYMHELAARVRTSADLQTDIWRESYENPGYSSIPFKKGKYRQKGKGKLGRYHATCQSTSVVQTAPAAASSASAATDREGDNRGGSGASGVDESGSAEAIAAAALVLMNPPVKQLTHAEEAARRGAISFLQHQMGSPGKTSDTATVQAITTRLDLPKGAGPQAVRRTLVQKRKRME